MSQAEEGNYIQLIISVVNIVCTKLKGEQRRQYSAWQEAVQSHQLQTLPDPHTAAETADNVIDPLHSQGMASGLDNHHHHIADNQSTSLHSPVLQRQQLQSTRWTIEWIAEVVTLSETQIPSSEIVKEYDRMMSSGNGALLLQTSQRRLPTSGSQLVSWATAQAAFCAATAVVQAEPARHGGAAAGAENTDQAARGHHRLTAPMQAAQEAVSSRYVALKAAKLCMIDKPVQNCNFSKELKAAYKDSVVAHSLAVQVGYWSLRPYHTTNTFHTSNC